MGLLNRLANRRGGLFVCKENTVLAQNISNITREFLEFVASINNEYTPKGAKGIQPRVGFYCEEAFSACSMAGEKEDAFGVSIGALAQLQWFFTQAIKNNLLNLTKPRDVARETVTITEYSLTSEINDSNDFSRLSKHQQLMVTKFSTMSCLLLLQHELAHLWNGHADLVGAHAQGKISKDIWPDAKGEIDKISHLLELDADARASRAVLIHLFPAGVVGKDERLIFDTRLNHDDLFEIRLIYNIIYTYIVFRFSHHLSTSDNPIGVGKSHPATLSRIWWHIDILRNQFCLQGNIPFDHFDKICENALFTAEQAFQIINRVNEDLISFRESRHFAMQNRHKLLTLWPNIASCLEEYRRGTSLPKLLNIDASLVPPVDLPSISDIPPMTFETRDVSGMEDKPETATKPHSNEDAEPRFFGKRATELPDINSIMFSTCSHIDRIKHACRAWPFKGPISKCERKILNNIQNHSIIMHQKLHIILSATCHNDIINPWEGFLKEFYGFSRSFSICKYPNESSYVKLCIANMFFDDILRYVERCATFISGDEKGNVNDIIFCDYISHEFTELFHGVEIAVRPVTTYALPVLSVEYPVYSPKRFSTAVVDQDKARIANIATIAMSFVDEVISGFKEIDRQG